MRKPFTLLLALGAATWMASSALAETDSAQALNPDPSINRKASRDYTSLVDRDAAFRSKRIREECDPIQDADLRQQCVASFSNGATTAGTGTMSSGSGK
jgi:hypothetical protein